MENGAVMQAHKKASARHPILALVDEENKKAAAFMPRPIWAPLSYLVSEAGEAIKRIEKMAPTVPDEHKWAVSAALTKWDQALAWYNEMFDQSQNIEGLRSWQLTMGLQQANGNQARPSAAVVPDFPQPQPPGVAEKVKPRGLRFN